MGKKRCSSRKSDYEISRINKLFANNGRRKSEAVVGTESERLIGVRDLDEEQLRRARFSREKDLKRALAKKKFALVIETEQKVIEWIVHSFRQYRMDQGVIRQVNVEGGFAVIESVNDNVTACVPLDGIRGVEWDGEHLTFAGSRQPIAVDDSVIYVVGCETGVYCRLDEVEKEVGNHNLRPTKFLVYNSPAFNPE